MKFLQKYWPTISAGAAAVLPFLMPSILAYISAHPHSTVGVLLAALVAAYHARAPKDQTPPPPSSGNNSQGIGAKMILIAMCLVLFPHPVHAQSPSNLYAFGVSGNPSATPQIAGTALYAHALSQSGTYAFTVLDALPNTLKPFTVTTNVSAGVAQKVFSIGKFPVFVPSSAGVSFSGSNTGWAWSTGGMTSIPLKAKSAWRIFPNVRVVKSSVGNGSGYQLIVGTLVGWGN